MKTIFICEGSKPDIRVEPGEDEDGVFWLRQGDDNIYFDAAQRDELIKALGQMTAPGEELEEYDDDD
jgi:hypothetical protein